MLKRIAFEITGFLGLCDFYLLAVVIALPVINMLRFLSQNVAHESLPEWSKFLLTCGCYLLMIVTCMIAILVALWASLSVRQAFERLRERNEGRVSD